VVRDATDPDSTAILPDSGGHLPGFSAIMAGVSPIPSRRRAMIRKIQHIGVAVRSLSEAIPFYRDVLGLAFLGIEEVAEQKVRTAVFRVGESTIEVLESTSPDGPVGKFLEKNGEGIHHLCLRVDDAAAALAHAKERGIRLIDETPRTGVHGMKIGFLHPKSTFGVLTEFAQDGGKEPG
jgi:methylmalonyl-CoA/ethylmalonyl-CoA epimerase